MPVELGELAVDEVKEKDGAGQFDAAAKKTMA
jgi:hypothetical protein